MDLDLLAAVNGAEVNNALGKKPEEERGSAARLLLLLDRTLSTL